MPQDQTAAQQFPSPLQSALPFSPSSNFPRESLAAAVPLQTTNHMVVDVSGFSSGVE
jgi:hypothetical protein